MLTTSIKKDRANIFQALYKYIMLFFFLNFFTFYLKFFNRKTPNKISIERDINEICLSLQGSHEKILRDMNLENQFSLLNLLQILSNLLPYPSVKILFETILKPLSVIFATSNNVIFI